MAFKTHVAKCNKWVCLACAGLVGAAGYGITEISHASTSGSHSLASKEYIDLRTNSRDSSPYEYEEPSTALTFQNPDSLQTSLLNHQTDDPDLLDILNSSQMVIQDPSIITDPDAAVVYSDYTLDAAYIKSLGKSSMGWKFRHSVILAPKGSKIWDHKAQKLKERAMAGGFGDKSRGLGRYKNMLYNAWNRENIDMNTMDGNKMHSLCTDILSYNDYGIWFTAISRLNYKGFFDFVWEACGRENAKKPSDWRYANGY